MKNIKDIVEILEKRGSEPNQVIVETAINAAIDVLKRIKRNSEPRTDFQGWPEDEVTFGQLKSFLINEKELEDNAKVRILMDDGMGYGALNGICTGVNVSESPTDENNKEIHLWF